MTSFLIQYFFFVKFDMVDKFDIVDMVVMVDKVDKFHMVDMGKVVGRWGACSHVQGSRSLQVLIVECVRKFIPVAHEATPSLYFHYNSTN